MKKLLFLIAIGWFLSSASAAYGYMPADWMHQVFGRRPDTQLVSVAIPGTHNSATNAITIFSRLAPNVPRLYGLAKPFISGWSRTQFSGVYDQMMRGIRYFDLRIAYRKERAYVVHGLVSMSLEKVVRDFMRFTAEHPKEIILVRVEVAYEVTQAIPRDETSAMRERAQQEIRDGLGAYMIPFSAHRTFGECWSAGGSLMLLDEIDKFWPQSGSLPQVKAYLNQKLRQRDPTRFNDMQMIFTANSAGEILKPLLHVNFNFKSNSLSIFSDPLRKAGLQWLKDWDAQGYRLNIVTTDFITLFPFAKTLIDLNVKNFP